MVGIIQIITIMCILVFSGIVALCVKDISETKKIGRIIGNVIVILIFSMLICYDIYQLYLSTQL